MGEIIDRAKGKAKQVEGKLTGDKLRENQGIADQIKGNLKGVVHKAKTAAKNIASTVRGAHKNNSKP
jgi:uncharacterized protein YjbJ (UPF0337 family)